MFHRQKEPAATSVQIRNAERHPLWEQTKVRSVLASAGLFAEDMDKKVRMLSGGERAKLALAVFSCENANVLILDEPTAGLDPKGRDTVLGLIQQYQKNTDSTVLVVSHSMEDISKILL